MRQSPFQSVIEGTDKLYREVYEEYIKIIESERKAQRKHFWQIYISRMGYIDNLKSRLDRLFNFSNELLNANLNYNKYQSRGED